MIITYTIENTSEYLSIITIRMGFDLKNYIIYTYYSYVLDSQPTLWDLAKHENSNLET